MLTAARRRTICAAVLALAVFAGWQGLRWGGDDATRVAGAVGGLAFSCFAVVCAARAASTSGDRQRAAWICLAAGLVGWVIAALHRTLAVTTSWGHALPPNVEGFGRLLLPVGVALAAIVIPLVRSRTGFRLLLDGVIVAMACYVVGWVVVLRGLAAVPSTLQFSLGIVAVVTDLAMISIAFMVMAKTVRGSRMSLCLLTSALIVIGLTDALHLYGLMHSVDPRLMTVGWAAGMCLVGLSGLTSKVGPPLGDDSKQQSRLSLWLPYVPVPFAIVLGAAELWPEHNMSRYIIVPGLVLILAALLRQFTLLDENRRLLRNVEGVAMHDPLTGLGNRALFSNRLTEAMQVTPAGREPVAVLLLDVDEFKLVNDSLGHPAGDALLCEVAERIRLNVGAEHTVARIGGDEFAVIVCDTFDVATAIAHRIVAAFDEPIVVDGRPLYIRVSLGLATVAGPQDLEISADELLRRADLAMYSAKRAEEGDVRAFEPTMSHEPSELSSHQRMGPRDNAPARTQLLTELRQAIDECRLELVYQPKVSLSTNEVVGVEALLRWPHPRFGVLEPGDFLPLVRENDLIDDVTNIVLPMAVSDAAGWYAAGLRIPVAVNLSTPSLNDETLPDRVAAVLDAHGMSAGALLIEITEDVLLASVVRARSVLDRLRHNGVRVAIDDFGSGFATMKYLRDLPVDELKIDQQFVTPMLEDGRCAMIVRSIIELADSLGIESVAEGVEDAGTALLLRDFGCDVVQGHYFSPPVPAASIRPGIWGTAPSGCDDGEARVRSVQYGEDALQGLRVTGDLEPR